MNLLRYNFSKYAAEVIALVENYIKLKNLGTCMHEFKNTKYHVTVDVCSDYMIIGFKDLKTQLCWSHYMDQSRPKELPEYFISVLNKCKPKNL